VRASTISPVSEHSARVGFMPLYLEHSKFR